MELLVFCIFDSKGEIYGTPFFLGARGLAIRTFMDLIQDARTVVSRYPADYTLFELGSWSPVTAKFSLLDTPRSLGVALEFKALEEAKASREKPFVCDPAQLDLATVAEIQSIASKEVLK